MRRISLKHYSYISAKNKMPKFNKRGNDELIISPFFFLMLGVIGIAIITAVVVILSSDSDIRVGEAKTLNDRLVYSLDESGYLNEKIFSGEFDILKDSNIDPKMIENSNDFYFNVGIYDEEGNLKYSFIKGNNDFEIQCGLNGKNLAKCFTRDISLINPKDTSQIFKIKIISGANTKDI
jgi:hypothetical protein